MICAVVTVFSTNQFVASFCLCIVSLEMFILTSCLGNLVMLYLVVFFLCATIEGVGLFLFETPCRTLPTRNALKLHQAAQK